ncbi:MULTISPECIES: monovalent cation:proton antiporter-2 (CPA2) family protein [unclassified Kaistella]|uniref:monovalent cation:proton antiporter-2 (CPA2) family protein n=1 Tax=unclassified Kaistella TaxID=2762626 RepID=UPI002735305B|nr:MULTISPECIES: monovalent cation:proton antiporter-2 (CPA2) family protein [unclassified Kaistella]MCZ2082692.1 monovalent cation:proton antiporter-2 (CPA2) family protein [Flavobacteriales bacterium]MDP2452631.1 monovalent cation:proton antiporter-2 (CPA2) family protein [Kaistella sp. SH11-4b]MDP2455539.1 monovalent cation:proton antiporter-2 (CPA2) family protein [Kaistella sp. SH40-3]MDP2458443.1 monovalent cation:proton antiporter-2 (CPA2) family protein [Kaistella sp. SH19-2b]
MNETSTAQTALIFLGAAIIMVPLVRKLGLSSVIGFILGGIIIGPFGLKLTGNDTHDIMQATEFGVIMLLFLVGLEIEPRKFWKIRKKIIGMGLGQMAITVSLLFLIFYLADWRTDQALVAALCFGLSSTAIVLQTLKEKNIFRTEVGEASFSILLFQDIAVIPILALLPIIAKKSDKDENQLLLQYLPDWLQPFSIILGVLALIILGRYIFVPFLRYVSRSGMNELLTASSLFLVIGVSELMHAVGLSPALGAFIAGVMLATSEFRHELESQIDPFKGLLLAVFFVSVGSTINFTVIMGDPMFIFTTTVVVLIVKFLVLVGVLKFFKLKLYQNFLVAFGLSQIGEFAFVLINYSTKLYLFDPKLNAQLMAITAITMCVTPILLLLNEKFIEPRIHKIKNEEPELELEGNIKQQRIIIVGFGHFGSTVGRLLRVNGIGATVLDNDPERINLLRSKGFKVYYGDASKPGILRSAGAENADLLILCLDSPEKNKFIMEYAREHFPQLKIFVRAKNRLDAYDFINNGVENIYRETLGTAVNMAVDILRATGMRAYAARRLGQRFMVIDKAMTRKLAKEQLNDKVTFTMTQYLDREAELLAEDSHSFDESQWNEYEEYQN